jgi:hypothetical protein
MTTDDSHIGSHSQHRLSDQVSANTSQDRTPAPATPQDPSLATNYRRSGLVHRRILFVAGRPDEGPLTEPTAATQPRPREPPYMVESECGAVAVGRTYLLPPLSSGGASLVRPWLRFHTPLIGRVEDWRAGLGRSCFPCWLALSSASVPVSRPCHVSSPLRVARSVRISRTARPHLLRLKAYGTYHAGAAFNP